jgi:hypothetical protein
VLPGAGSDASVQHFSDAAELQQQVENDLAVLLSERFELARSGDGAAGEASLHAYVPRAPHDDAALAALRARTGDAAYEKAQAGADPSEAGTPDSTH